MTAPAKHRWFRFSLRTMFVVVTICAFACYWYAQRRTFEVIGQISEAELRAICKVVASRSPPDARITKIELVVPRIVQVTYDFRDENRARHFNPTPTHLKAVGYVKGIEAGSETIWEPSGWEISPREPWKPTKRPSCRRPSNNIVTAPTP